MNNIEELEKMVKEACEKNDYALYKKACCLLHLYIKVCPEGEEEIACFVLYSALCDEKSQGFITVVRELINSKNASKADIILYGLFLLVTVRDDNIVGFLLAVCDIMQDTVLKKLLEEEKK